MSNNVLKTFYFCIDLCFSVSALYVNCLHRPKEDMGDPGALVTDSYELLDVGRNSVLLEEQQMFLTTELPL